MWGRLRAMASLGVPVVCVWTCFLDVLWNAWRAWGRVCVCVGGEDAVLPGFRKRKGPGGPERLFAFGEAFEVTEEGLSCLVEGRGLCLWPVGHCGPQILAKLGRERELLAISWVHVETRAGRGVYSGPSLLHLPRDPPLPALGDKCCPRGVPWPPPTLGLDEGLEIIGRSHKLGFTDTGFVLVKLRPLRLDRALLAGPQLPPF